MNKILAILCAAGVAAIVAVVIVIQKQEQAPENKGAATNGASAKITATTDKHPVVEQPSNTAAAKPEKRIVADALDNPCGVAVQPETGHVFVSMIGRIVRVVPGAIFEVHDEVTGFATDTYGRGPVYSFGPLGLAFADHTTLVVGDGSQPDGKEIVRLYQVAAQPLPKDKVRDANDMLTYSTPVPPGDDSLQGEGNFFGVAIRGSTAFVTSNGDDSKGWICKLELDRSKPAPLPLIPFIKSKELTNTSAPMGATISPGGKLVVSQFGAANAFPDSLLTFYDPLTGKLEQKLHAGLRDVIGIAYSPRTGQLYGLDFSWAKPGNGGLFRLDITGDKVQAVKIADVDRPTALAFTPSGTLYVTAIGPSAAKGTKTGQLLVFEGL